MKQPKDQKIIDHFNQWCKTNACEYPDTPAAWHEILSECAQEIQETIESSSRWYDHTRVVVDFDGMLLRYNWYHMTGDSSVHDMGLEFDIESIVRVMPKEVTKIVYVTL